MSGASFAIWQMPLWRSMGQLAFLDIPASITTVLALLIKQEDQLPTTQYVPKNLTLLMLIELLKSLCWTLY